MIFKGKCEKPKGAFTSVVAMHIVRRPFFTLPLKLLEKKQGDFNDIGENFGCSEQDSAVLIAKRN